mmetsp:Transcript_132985/g.315169  ORF Transcript_132985/g.315169 Transcript_132985/m.315169 type:complete len:240 (+) Transcript_132985:474-1193(+)
MQEVSQAHLVLSEVAKSRWLRSAGGVIAACQCQLIAFLQRFDRGALQRLMVKVVDLLPAHLANVLPIATDMDCELLTNKVRMVHHTKDGDLICIPLVGALRWDHRAGDGDLSLPRRQWVALHRARATHYTEGLCIVGPQAGSQGDMHPAAVTHIRDQAWIIVMDLQSIPTSSIPNGHTYVVGQHQIFSPNCPRPLAGLAPSHHALTVWDDMVVREVVVHGNLVCALEEDHVMHKLFRSR